MSWPCRTERCANPAEDGRRKLCSACLATSRGPKKKRPKKCRIRGCPRPQIRDGLCAPCHPQGATQAEEIVAKAVADGESPRAALRRQGKSPHLAIELLMRADTQARIAHLMASAGFQPAQGLRTLARLLDAKTIPHPKLAMLAVEAGQPADAYAVDDNATQLEAVKLWREIVGLQPESAAAGGGGGNKIGIAVHVGQVPAAGAENVRGAYLPPLKPIDESEIIEVGNDPRDDD